MDASAACRWDNKLRDSALTLSDPSAPPPPSDCTSALYRKYEAPRCRGRICLTIIVLVFDFLLTHILWLATLWTPFVLADSCSPASVPRVKCGGGGGVLVYLKLGLKLLYCTCLYLTAERTSPATYRVKRLALKPYRDAPPRRKKANHV